MPNMRSLNLNDDFKLELLAFSVYLCEGFSIVVLQNVDSSNSLNQQKILYRNQNQ